MVEWIQKRDGRQIPFVREKITRAIYLAASVVAKESQEEPDYGESERLTDQVVAYLMSNYKSKAPSVEQVQDAVVNVLIQNGHTKTSEAYILYRNERNRIRSLRSRLMQSIEAITYADDSSVKDDSVTMDVSTPIGTLMQYGSTISKEFCLTHVINPKFGKLHETGEIYIHDLDFMNMGTLTSCHIDLDGLFHRGFSSGLAFFREPQDIASYVALCVIAMQSNQNDQHGAQSIPAFDYYFAKGVAKTFHKKYIANVNKALVLCRNECMDLAPKIVALEEACKHKVSLSLDYTIKDSIALHLVSHYKLTQEEAIKVLDFAYREARDESESETYQAMEALLHSLNAIHSQSGFRVPYTSINFGSDVSIEGRMVIQNLLLALNDGLGNGETPRFPIFNFKVKEGINLNKEDPNYDLFQLSLRVHRKRQCMHYIFLDAPFNALHYREGDFRSEVAMVGSNTRVFEHCSGKATSISRGNNAFTTINLPRLALNHGYPLDEERFLQEVDQAVEVVVLHLMERKALQASKRVRNFPFLMGQDVWEGSSALEWSERVEKVLSHGTYAVGYLGLAQCLQVLLKAHHGQRSDAQALGLAIIKRIKDKCKEAQDTHHLNFGVIATSTKGLGKRFYEMDQQLFGVQEEWNSLDHYSDGSCLPSNFETDGSNKIKIEAPYHQLSLMGHLTTIYLEDALDIQDTMQSCIYQMKEQGIGYATIKINAKK